MKKSRESGFAMLLVYVMAAPLKEVAEWTERYRQIWEQHFDSLELYLQQMKAKEKKHGGKRRSK